MERMEMKEIKTPDFQPGEREEIPLSLEMEQAELDLEMEKMLIQARKDNNTWVFRDKEYPLYLVDGTGGASLTLLHPETNKPFAEITANFMWEKSGDFMEHLDFGFKQITNLNTNSTIEEQKNNIIRNDKLFRALLQGGMGCDIDEFGNKSQPETLTRQEVLGLLEQEYRARIVIDWLDSLSIDRYIEPGVKGFRNILKNETLKFIARVGDYDNPQFVFIMEFAKPTADARRAYEDNAVVREREVEVGKTTVHTVIDPNVKRQFAIKYFIGVEGVAIGKPGVKYNPNDSEIVTAFKKGFIPTWWVRFADAIHDSFGNVGKN